MANILIPAQIPWMVSPSTPLLRLDASEAARHTLTEVKVIGYFALEEQSDHGNPLVITKIPPIEKLDISTEKSVGPYKLIRIQFTQGLWVRMNPSHSESEIVDWSRYQRSEIIPSLHTFRDASDYISHFRDQWEKSGICPDPRIYEVADSDWIRDTCANDDVFHHFLIFGHDSYIEILAQKWEWELIGIIDGI